MFRVPSLFVLLGLMLCVLPSHNTMAQQSSESGVDYEAARNKIGLIRYCRGNQLLDPVIAGQAIAALETGLREPPSNDTFAREQGDRAQQAGEDGFWSAGRGRDIASVAKLLFRTTPADLCQEWAHQILRAQAQGHSSEVAAGAVVAPIQPLLQAGPTSVEPIQVERPPAGATAVVRAAHSAPPPPLPEKAPTEAELASLQRTLPTSGRLASTGRAVPGHISGTTAVTSNALPPSSPLASEVADPLPREQTVTAAVPSPLLYDQPQPLREKQPFNRLGTPERCLLRGCKWPAPQERRSW